MSLTKNNIINYLKKNSSLSVGEASSIFESFLSVIKSKSKSKSVKLSGFGTFSFKKTPKRAGRNPKTKDSYIIPELYKLNFKPSSKVKEQIN
ncbi:MAG: HU family DNA-binding protein [Gammaproteobacteria bacterium]|jgi:nucleoid DNA-binding protein|nr:HU family DNA-binding protein [Gammaproteobacteria bacterium]